MNKKNIRNQHYRLTPADINTIIEVRHLLGDVVKIFAEPSAELATMLTAWEKLNRVIANRLVREL